MASLSTNPLLPILAGVLVVAAGLSAYFVSGKESDLARVNSQGKITVGTPIEADADTTTDTINALSGMVDGLRTTVADVTEHNESLIAEKEAIREETDREIQSIKASLGDEMSLFGEQQRETMETLAGQLKDMTVEINKLERDLTSSHAAQPVSDVPSTESEVDQGRRGGDNSRNEESASGGFRSLDDMLKAGLESTGQSNDAHNDHGIEFVPGIGLDALRSGDVAPGTDLVDFVWIDPLDRPSSAARSTEPESTSTGLRTASIRDIGVFTDARDMPSARSRSHNADQGSARQSSNVLRDQASHTTERGNTGSGANENHSVQTIVATGNGGERDIGPRFTLPDLSMMTGAVSLTSIVGRVFSDEEITDPWPFKTMIGRDNMTASFHDLPAEIDGMLYEGYGVGDWTLSCVRGWVTVASFVFDDGTVVPAYADSPGTREKEHRLNPDAIGYLSDRYGNPCVSGERVTNAAGFLASRTVAAAATGYARALNAGNEIVQESIGADGTVSTVSRVIDASANFAARDAYAAAFSEGAQWIKERQAQSFDAVYVPSGTEVVVNLQAELRLDKRPDARTLSYSAVKEARHHGLD